MRTPTPYPVLSEAFGPTEGAARVVKTLLLMALGIAALAIAAKIRVPMWPVPITMQTFVVFLLGSFYGVRLGVGTVLAYLAIGALGADLFTGSSATVGGLSYMVGPTGGYLAGFVLAAAVMGAFARRGWNRSFAQMALSLLIANAVLYASGLAWMSYLFLADKGAAWVLQYGFLNFALGDALKLALATALVPALTRALSRR